MDWTAMLEGAPAALREDTLCAAFQRTIAERGDVVALRTKSDAVSATLKAALGALVARRAKP